MTLLVLELKNTKLKTALEVYRSNKCAAEPILKVIVKVIMPKMKGDNSKMLCSNQRKFNNNYLEFIMTNANNLLLTYY